jgi:dTDP-4-amino-4,6-dideoxygalactose transaminase
MDSVLNCLVTDKLGPGDYTERLMRLAKERLGFEFGLAVRNPAIALETAINALALQPGDSVACSALAQPWVCKVLENRKIEPVWLDVDISSASFSASSLERLASKPVKALYLDGAWGILPDQSLFAELGIPVIEDISYSIGGRTEAFSAGGIGTLVILGLEHASSITAGGGAILYAPGRREGQALRNTSEKLLAMERIGEMNAALALPQLRDMDKFITKRRELTELFLQSLARSHKRALTASIECEPACFGLVVVLDSGVKDVRAYAKKKDVDSAMAFDDTCLAVGLVPEGLCPDAASLVQRSVAFPLNQRVGKNAAQKIAKVLASLP